MVEYDRKIILNSVLGLYNQSEINAIDADIAKKIPSSGNR
jgi:hypothetical protein